VSVPPDDLKAFLHRWFDCLAKLKVPLDDVAAVLDACEAAYIPHAAEHAFAAVGAR